MKNYKIAITTGDKKGIGKEITKKALDILKPNQEYNSITEFHFDFLN